MFFLYDKYKKLYTKTSGTRSILTQFQVINISVLKFKTFSLAKMTFCALSVFALRLQVMRQYNASQKHAPSQECKGKISLYHIPRLVVQCFPLITWHLSPQRSRVHSLLKDPDSLSWYKKWGEKVSSILYFNITHTFMFQRANQK